METRGSRLAQLLKRLRQPAPDHAAQHELDRTLREAGPPHRTAERRPKQNAERR